MDVKQVKSTNSSQHPEYVFCDVKKGAWQCQDILTKKRLPNISSKEIVDRQKYFLDKELISNQFDISDQMGNGLGSIHFEFDSNQIEPIEAAYLLRHVYGKINGKHLLIFGFTDNVGTEQYNDHLALNRAKAIKEFFASRGIPETSITVKGSGICCYLVPNGTDLQRRINRRAEIYLAL